MDKPKILVVDDEPDLLSTLEYRLQQEGYEVDTADNGLTALERAQADRHDLIILDVMLPGENGYRVAQTLREGEVRAGRSRTPILLLTARDLSSDPEREKMFMDFSRADFMMYKPFDMGELLETIQSLLAGPADA
jgi:DNA-binding response OmpR family regulator